MKASRRDRRDPFRSSPLAVSAGWRVAAAAGLAAVLWLAVLWAVSLP